MNTLPIGAYHLIQRIIELETKAQAARERLKALIPDMQFQGDYHILVSPGLYLPTRDGVLDDLRSLGYSQYEQPETPSRRAFASPDDYLVACANCGKIFAMQQSEYTRLEQYDTETGEVEDWTCDSCQENENEF